MHKKTAKTHRKSCPRMTIRENSSFGGKTAEQQSNNNRIKRSSTVGWEFDTDPSSWSEDHVGDAPARRVLEQWRIFESVLYDDNEEENAQVALDTSLYDECLQWRTQLPHLRIVGRADRSNPAAMARPSSNVASTPLESMSNNSSAQIDAKLANLAALNNDYENLSTRMSELSCHATANFRQAKEQVLDYIVDFLCKDLAEIEAEKDAEDRLNENFEEFLKIAPAPMCIGKNPLNSNNAYYKIDSADATDSQDKDNKVNGRKKQLQSRRNKLGTVFNEKVIVSPVPFVVTARESFTTLRTTPIQFFKENHRVSANGRSALKQDNVKRTFSLTRKTHLAPRVQAPWNTSVCPPIYPKNVKLTPIDISRLPRTKPRPSKTADSVNLRSSRNSLSPISRSVHAKSPHIRENNLLGQLEIRGSHIVVQEPSLVNKQKIRKKITQADHHKDE